MNFYIYHIKFIVIFNLFEVNLSLRNSKNICLVPETYVEKGLVPRVETKIVKKVSFCWNPKYFFRCTNTIKIPATVFESKSIERTRIVSKCCAGYQKDPFDRFTCIPFCWPPCNHGSCTAPNTCSCSPGFQGATCAEPCPSTFWGHNCSEQCECMNKAICDSVTGDCFCESGWRGPRCESLCEYGFYGPGCQRICNCSSGLCDPQTGVCVSTTTETTASTDFTSAQNSDLEVFEEATTSTTGSTTHNSIVPLENDSLFYLRQNILEERTTTTVANLEDVPKTESETSSAATDDSKTQTFSEATEIHLETASTTEVGTKETVSLEETAHAVKILKNLESDKTNNNNMSELIESENKKNEIKFIKKTEKNYRNEINKNDLIESTTSGEYVAKEIKTEKKDAGADKNIAGERESHSHAFQFMPSLIVLSGVSIVILIIGARWLISNRRTRKIEKLREEKLFHQTHYKFTESVHTGNSFFEEPIHMANMNLSTKEPPAVLLSFKPADI